MVRAVTLELKKVASLKHWMGNVQLAWHRLPPDPSIGVGGWSSRGSVSEIAA